MTTEADLDDEDEPATWRVWIFPAIVVAILVGFTVFCRAQTVIVLDAADLRALDAVIQTSIPPAYSVRLIEWINAMAKRQADRAKEEAPK